MNTLRVGVAGAMGRMGQAVSAAVKASDNAELVCVWERPGNEHIGTPYPGTALTLYDDISTADVQIDVVIDFTAPAPTVEHAQWCADNDVSLVVGTTGLEEQHLTALKTAGNHIGVVQAPNMSVGVNVLCELAAQAATMLGSDFDMEIVETHHSLKKDAPSGTAMRLLNVLKESVPDTQERFERHGIIGARPANEIGVQTLRGGDVVGEHTVFYFGTGERIELTHRATDRSIFAQGALRAAQWLCGREPGLYTMHDVLSR